MNHTFLSADKWEERNFCAWIQKEFILKLQLLTYVKQLRRNLQTMQKETALQSLGNKAAQICLTPCVHAHTDCAEILDCSFICVSLLNSVLRRQHIFI